jgi:hypothetical protein
LTLKGTFGDRKTPKLCPIFIGYNILGTTHLDFAVICAGEKGKVILFDWVIVDDGGQHDAIVSLPSGILLKIGRPTLRLE